MLFAVRWEHNLITFSLHPLLPQDPMRAAASLQPPPVLRQRVCCAFHCAPDVLRFHSDRTLVAPAPHCMLPVALEHTPTAPRTGCARLCARLCHSASCALAYRAPFELLSLLRCSPTAPRQLEAFCIHVALQVRRVVSCGAPVAHTQLAPHWALVAFLFRFHRSPAVPPCGTLVAALQLHRYRLSRCAMSSTCTSIPLTHSTRVTDCTPIAGLHTHHAAHLTAPLSRFAFAPIALFMIAPCLR